MAQFNPGRPQAFQPGRTVGTEGRVATPNVIAEVARTAFQTAGNVLEGQQELAEAKAEQQANEALAGEATKIASIREGFGTGQDTLGIVKQAFGVDDDADAEALQVAQQQAAEIDSIRNQRGDDAAADVLQNRAFIQAMRQNPQLQSQLRKIYLKDEIGEELTAESEQERENQLALQRQQEKNALNILNNDLNVTVPPGMSAVEALQTTVLEDGRSVQEYLQQRKALELQVEDLKSQEEKEELEGRALRRVEKPLARTVVSSISAAAETAGAGDTESAIEGLLDLKQRIEADAVGLSETTVNRYHNRMLAQVDTAIEDIQNGDNLIYLQNAGKAIVGRAYVQQLNQLDDTPEGRNAIEAIAALNNFGQNVDPSVQRAFSNIIDTGFLPLLGVGSPKTNGDNVNDEVRKADGSLDMTKLLRRASGINEAIQFSYNNPQTLQARESRLVLARALNNSAKGVNTDPEALPAYRKVLENVADPRYLDLIHTVQGDAQPHFDAMGSLVEASEDNLLEQVIPRMERGTFLTANRGENGVPVLEVNGGFESADARRRLNEWNTTMRNTVKAWAHLEGHQDYERTSEELFGEFLDAMEAGQSAPPSRIATTAGTAGFTGAR